MLWFRTEWPCSVVGVDVDFRPYSLRSAPLRAGENPHQPPPLLTTNSAASRLNICRQPPAQPSSRRDLRPEPFNTQTLKRYTSRCAHPPAPTSTLKPCPRDCTPRRTGP